VHMSNMLEVKKEDLKHIRSLQSSLTMSVMFIISKVNNCLCLVEFSHMRLCAGGPKIIKIVIIIIIEKIENFMII